MCAIIKLFISHKNEDELLEVLVKHALDKKQILSHFYILGNEIVNNGKATTEHVKENLNCCTDD